MTPSTFASIKPSVCFLILASLFWSLTTSAEVTFTDPLKHPTDNWFASTVGTGPSITFAGDGMAQRYPANTTSSPANGNISAIYTANFLTTGDFDAQVDYRIDAYSPVPGHPASGLRVQISFDDRLSAERVGWENLGYDVYLANHYWNMTTAPTGDLNGSLRLVRQGGQVSSYYKSGGGWNLIATSALQAQDRGPVQIKLSSGYPSYAFPGTAANAVFSNFKVTADKISGLPDEPNEPSPETTAATVQKNSPYRLKPDPAAVTVLHRTAVPAVTSSGPSAPATLDIKWAPALSLTGEIGSNYRIEYTVTLGSVNEWFDLTTVTLTNSPQIYFDSSAIGQPSRFYRSQKVP